jgi:hypothetical protein
MAREIVGMYEKVDRRERERERERKGERVRKGERMKERKRGRKRKKGAAQIALPLELKPMLIRFSFSSPSQEIELRKAKP